MQILNNMEVAIWHTYVKRKDITKEMQFDIIVPQSMNDMQTIIEFGLEYINTKPFDTWGLSSTECENCQVENQIHKMIKTSIQNKGYAIKELENCN